MTNEEAIYWLKVLDECEIKCPDSIDPKKFAYGVTGAMNMAVGILQGDDTTAIVPTHGEVGGYCMKCDMKVALLNPDRCPECGRKVINYGMKEGE